MCDILCKSYTTFSDTILEVSTHSSEINSLITYSESIMECIISKSAVMSTIIQYIHTIGIFHPLKTDFNLCSLFAQRWPDSENFLSRRPCSRWPNIEFCDFPHEIGTLQWPGPTTFHRCGPCHARVESAGVEYHRAKTPRNTSSRV